MLRRSGWKSVKDGCARGDCGSCAVLVDGRAVTACLVFAAKAEGTDIITAEGLAPRGELHPLQRGLLDSGGVQCGFCTPGVLMTAVELFTAEPEASAAELTATLAGNMCRCTGYVKLIEGLLAGAETMRGSR